MHIHISSQMSDVRLGFNHQRPRSALPTAILQTNSSQTTILRVQFPGELLI